jgi:hypothetical protein
MGAPTLENIIRQRQGVRFLFHEGCSANYADNFPRTYKAQSVIWARLS